MTLIQTLKKYFDEKVAPQTLRRGGHMKLKTAYLQAKAKEVDNLDEFIKIAENLDLPKTTYLALKSLVNFARKEAGLTTSLNIEEIAHKEITHRTPLKYDLDLDEVVETLRIQSGVVGCICALALCCLSPEEMTQVMKVSGDTIYFTGGKESKEVPTFVQHVVDEFVNETVLQTVLEMCNQTGDPKIDRYEIIDLLQQTKNDEFNLSVKQLRNTSAVIHLMRNGMESIDEVADMLSIQVQSLRNAVRRWVAQESINQETFQKITNA